LVNISLPPNSVTTWCANWTPPASGTLHRCVLATLKQPGYLDQTSQRNIDIRRANPSNPGSLVIPFVAGNPDLVEHLLTFDAHLIGIDPAWTVKIETFGGGPLPVGPLGPGGQLSLQLRLVPPGGTLAPNAAIIPLINLHYGSQHSVEVTMLLDGQPAGGFSAVLLPNYIFMPAVRK
jgi:hypothetical protein